jgi:hypothetical protein
LPGAHKTNPHQSPEQNPESPVQSLSHFGSYLSKISVEIKNEIKKLVDFDFRIKPKAVLESLSKKGMEVPKKPSLIIT